MARLLSLAAAATLCACASVPHTIFILTDDLGMFAPGYNNPRMLTPAIDALAREGITLTSHYTYQFCAPSRGSLLTGRFPYKLSATRSNYIPPTLLDGIDTRYSMLPSRLAAAGYSSVHIGKWHQGLYATDLTPVARGFNASNGFLDGGIDHFTQASFYGYICPGRDIWVNDAVAPALAGQYTAFRFNDAAVDAITGAATGGAPLFMYLALQNTHAPMEAEARFEALYPNITYDTELKWYAMASTVDEVVANVTRALKSSGMWNDSVVVWTTDNGSPVTVGGSNAPFKGSKGSNWEGGVRTPALVTGGWLPPSRRGIVLEGPVHLVDWHATILTLAGLPVTDPSPDAPAPIDGLDLWPWLSGANATCPRCGGGVVTVLDHNMYGNNTSGAIRVGDWKLLVGPQPYATWYGEFSPPAPPAPAPNASITECSFIAPCLYNISGDPLEEHDVSGSQPEVLASMMAIFKALESEYHPPKEQPPEDKAGYCGAIKANGGFVAPWK